MFPSPNKFPRLRKFLKPPRTLQFTRTGRYAVGLTLGIGFAAMNTGNNLVYMIFGMMLGFITASGVISEMSLRGLEVDWILPDALTAGQEQTLRIILRNSKERLPSFGIRAEVLDPFWVSGGAETKSQVWTGGFFMIVPPRSQRSVDVPIRPVRRGTYALSRLRASTLFPFGFFQKSLVCDAEATFTVHPAESPLRLEEAEEARRRRDVPRPGPGPGDSFWSLREFAPGDDPRRISWRGSAKRDKLLVIETERDSERKIYLDLGPAEAWLGMGEADVESAVAFAATLLREKFRGGAAVGLRGEGFDRPPQARAKTLREILDYLAAFDPARMIGASKPPEASDRSRPFLNSPSLPLLESWNKARLRERT